VLGLLREASISEMRFVTDRDFEVEKLRMSICRWHNIFIDSNAVVDARSMIRFAPESRVILVLARDKASQLKVPCIDLNHLALALLEAQGWLRDLVEGFTGSIPRAIVRRLERCSSSQHLELNSSNASCHSTIELTVSFDEIDDQIELWSDIKATPAIGTIVDRLNKRSEVVFEHAILESKKLCCSKISVETIMLGLLSETFGPTYDVFTLLDLNLINSRKILAASCRLGSTRTVGSGTLSANALRLMEHAWQFAQLLKMNRIEPEHIVLAIAEEENGVAFFVCEALAIRGSMLRAEVITAMNKSNKCTVPS
jgi:Clp amino terminal domain, pathogenicity island component